MSQRINPVVGLRNSALVGTPRTLADAFRRGCRSDSRRTQEWMNYLFKNPIAVEYPAEEGPVGPTTGSTVIGEVELELGNVDYTGPTFYDSDGTVTDYAGRTAFNYTAWLLEVLPSDEDGEGDLEEAPESVTASSPTDQDDPLVISTYGSNVLVESDKSEGSSLSDETERTVQDCGEAFDCERQDASSVQTREPLRSLRGGRQSEALVEDVREAITAPVCEGVLSTGVPEVQLPVTLLPVRAESEKENRNPSGSGSEPSVTPLLDIKGKKREVETQVDPIELSNNDEGEGEGQAEEVTNTSQVRDSVENVDDANSPSSGGIFKTITNDSCRWRKLDGGVCSLKCDTVDSAQEHALAHLKDVTDEITNRINERNGTDEQVPKKELETQAYSCRWVGTDGEMCNKSVTVRCLAKHLGSKIHFHYKFECSLCGDRLSREDAYQRHSKKCPGPDKKKRKKRGKVSTNDAGASRVDGNNDEENG